MWKAAMTVAVGVGIASAPATAGPDTADELYRRCAAGRGTAEQGQCYAYIDGLLDMHSVVVGLKRSDALFCLPADGVPLGEAARAFVTWIDQHADSRRQTARIALVVALSRTYPCKGK